MKPIYRLIVIIFLSQSSLVHANDYVLGDGYDVGLWNISGYTSIEVNLPNRQAANFIVDDFAIFVHGRINQYINPFFEGEYSNQSLWTEGDGVLSSGAGHVVLERLYNDIYFTDALSLRFGKMLAPVGEWNLIHAAPLVATTIRPLTTYINFSEFATGISLNYVEEQRSLLPSVSVYYQPDEEFLPKPLTSRPYRYKNISGIQLVYAHDLDWRAAFSMQHAELVNRNERQNLFSWDGRYDFDIFSVETQVSYNQIYGNQNRQRNNEWGGYLQLSVPITEDWSLVGRGESFTARDAKTSQQNAVLGINYRPNAALVWKLEYLLVDGNTTGTPLNEGIYTSVGVMF
jgi:hypothetical protein